MRQTAAQSQVRMKRVMDKSGKKQEQKNEQQQGQKNRVAEAILRVRDREMQQEPTEEKLPSLSPEEYEDMYQKILIRLRAEGLMDEDDSEDSREEKPAGSAASGKSETMEVSEKKSSKREKEQLSEEEKEANEEKKEEKRRETAEKTEVARETNDLHEKSSEEEKRTERLEIAEHLRDSETEERSEAAGNSENESSEDGKAGQNTVQSIHGKAGQNAHGKTGKNSAKPTKIRWFQKKAVKVAGVCLITGAAVFGLSMTSEANRLLLMQTANEVLGTGDLMKANNGEDRYVPDGNEDEARQVISDSLNVQLPEFLYLPDGMSYQSYQLFDEIGYAVLEYSYVDGYLYLTVSNSLTDMSQGNIKASQEEVEEVDTLNGKMQFVIKQIEEGEEHYSASWEYKNVSYTLSGEISRNELIKILEKISYNM